MTASLPDVLDGQHAADLRKAARALLKHPFSWRAAGTPTSSVSSAGTRPN